MVFAGHDSHSSQPDVSAGSHVAGPCVRTWTNKYSTDRSHHFPRTTASRRHMEDLCSSRTEWLYHGSLPVSVELHSEFHVRADDSESVPPEHRSRFAIHHGREKWDAAAGRLYRTRV